MADPFHVRFNIDVKLEEAQRRFISRIENYVLTLTTLLRDFFGDQALDRIIILVEAELGEPHLTFVSSPGVFIEFGVSGSGTTFRAVSRLLKDSIRHSNHHFKMAQIV